MSANPVSLVSISTSSADAVAASLSEPARKTKTPIHSTTASAKPSWASEPDQAKVKQSLFNLDCPLAPMLRAVDEHIGAKQQTPHLLCLLLKKCGLPFGCWAAMIKGPGRHNWVLRCC